MLALVDTQARLTALLLVLSSKTRILAYLSNMTRQTRYYPTKLFANDTDDGAVGCLVLGRPA